MRAWNVSDFRVVVTGQPAVSKAALRIGKQQMTFSALAAAEMGYPPFVQILISDDASKMVVRPYDQGDPTAIPFYQEKYSVKRNRYEPPRAIAIRDKPLVRDIRERLNWGSELMVCSPLRFQERPDTLFFALSEAITASEAKAKRKENRTIESYPTLTAIMGAVQPVALCLAATQTA